MAMAMAEMYNTGDADKNEKLVKAEFIRVTHLLRIVFILVLFSGRHPIHNDLIMLITLGVGTGSESLLKFLV